MGAGVSIPDLHQMWTEFEGGARVGAQPRGIDPRYGKEFCTMKGIYPMRIRNLTLAAVSVLALGATACTQAEQNQAQADAQVAGDKAAEVAAQTGEAIEAGAMKTAQAVEESAGNIARDLEAKQAEAAAQGRAGAVNPITDERTPAN